MEWSKLYGPDRQPTEAAIAEYVASPLWAQLNGFLRERYGVEPSLSYSGCSAQPGWNVKYRKAGRSLCTLYPMEGFLIALVVIGAKEAAEAELLAPSCSAHVQSLLSDAAAVAGARWLMITVDSEAVLQDVERLIQLRRKIRK